MITIDSKYLFNKISEKIMDWAEQYPGIGAVVGATSPEELEQITKELHDVPLLIPGVGSQGGSASEVVSILKQNNYNLSIVRVNSSSSLTHPWHKRGERAPKNWLEVCLSSISSLMRELNVN